MIYFTWPACIRFYLEFARRFLDPGRPIYRSSPYSHGIARGLLILFIPVSH